jgi:hypothetical protein
LASASIDKNCTAFELENLEKQAREAENNPSLLWHQGNKKRTNMDVKN